jgi:hypothetical protein
MRVEDCDVWIVLLSFEIDLGSRAQSTGALACVAVGVPTVPSCGECLAPSRRGTKQGRKNHKFKHKQPAMNCFDAAKIEMISGMLKPDILTFNAPHNRLSSLWLAVSCPSTQRAEGVTGSDLNIDLHHHRRALLP